MGGTLEVGSKAVIWLAAVKPDLVTLISAVTTAESCQFTGSSTDTTDGWEDTAVTVLGAA